MQSKRLQFPGPRWLPLANAFCLALTFLILVLVVTGVPARFNSLASDADRRALLDLNLSLNFYAGYLTALQVVIVLAHILIALAIIRLRHNEWVCLFVGLTLVTNGAVIPLTEMAGPAPIAQLWSALAGLVIFAGLVSSITILFIFPTGTFVPGWTRWLALVWAGLIAITLFLPQIPLNLERAPLPLQVTILLFWSAAGVYALVHRYLRDSSAVHRQQIKWAVFGLSAAVLGPLLYFIPVAVLPSVQTSFTSNFLYQRIGAEFFALGVLLRLFLQTIFTFALLIFPITFAIAILRYRLWDIDVIIRRTLIYSALTAVLALLYFGSVIILQQLFRLVTGQSSDLAIILSTLGIAALFNRVRRGVQNAIDRRFYRRKYNAEQVLATFSAALRDQVELDKLTSELLNVVGETMQPEQVSLWLRADNKSGESR